MAKKYPKSDSFEMAPNAGIMDDRGIKQTAMDHASNMPDFGIGHVTSTAMRKDWSHDEYAMHPHSDGSMNYMSEKNSIMTKDAARVRRTFVKPGNAV